MSNVLNDTVGSSYDELRSYLLTEAERTTAEQVHPGAIELGLIERYRVNVLVYRVLLVFTFNEDSYGKRVPQVACASSRGPEPGSLLWKLAWHRAAEAMRGVQKGHESVRLRQATRKKKV